MARHYRFMGRLAVLLVLLLLGAACGEPESPQPPGASPTPTSPPPSHTTEPSPEAKPSPTPTRDVPTATTQPTVTPSIAAPPTDTVEPTATPLPTQPSTPTATSTSEPTAAPVAFPPRVELEPAFGGFSQPVYLTHDGQPGRLFIVEQAGRVHVIEDGQRLPDPFLDLTDRVGSGGSEQGLLSIAFPGRLDDRPIFYVDYTDRNGDTVISRFSRLPDDPTQGDPNSEEVLLRIAQPASNHNGGLLLFGPDGQLYVGMGDGGRGGDPWENAQNLEVLLGKLLRITVNGLNGYEVPADNPFIDRTDARPEIWAYGLRNPWRFSFDAATGDLYIADVGQNRYEEVDFEPAGSPGGVNYGWDIMEGAHCFEPEQGCDQTGLVLPIAEYGREGGCSITGGHVYRGERYPELVGTYFYGDFCSGNIWGLQQESNGEWVTALLLESGVSISSFGEDAAGELYVLGHRDGQIYRLVGTQ